MSQVNMARALLREMDFDCIDTGEITVLTLLDFMGVAGLVFAPGDEAGIAYAEELAALTRRAA